MKSKLIITTLFSCLFSICWANGNEGLKSNFVMGTPDIQSLKAISFGPEDILFIGDNTGMQLLAVDVKDQKRTSKNALQVSELNVKLAAAMGADKSQVTIQDMSVNPASGNVYLAVSKESNDQTSYALFRLSDDGLEEFSLENISYSQMQINDAPSEDKKTWRRPSRTYTVTDLHYANGEVIVSGLSNEEFSSGLRRVPFPFNNQMITTNVQVYHVSHGKNETHAPIYRFLPVQLQNQWHVVAGYMCTPLVTFPVEDLNGNKKLVGKTVAEIGAGNTPTGIISYTYEGKHYVLVGNNVHPLTKITSKDLFNANAIKSPSRDRGVKRENVRLGSISHISDYDEENILLVTRDKKNDLYALKTVSKAEI